MSKIKIQLVEDEEETSTVFERFWDNLVVFAKCVGVFAAICFAIGYFSSTKQAQAKQCEPTKTVLARSIFK
jgi:hypothetical protein